MKRSRRIYADSRRHRQYAKQGLIGDVYESTRVLSELSDDASAITGIDLPVDCGCLAGAHLSTYGGMRPAQTRPPAE